MLTYYRRKDVQVNGHEMIVHFSMKQEEDEIAARVELAFPPNYKSKLMVHANDERHPSQPVNTVITIALGKEEESMDKWMMYAFFNYTASLPDASEEERATLKGVGHKMLCALLRRMVLVGLAKVTDKLELEANGHFADDPTKSRMNGLVNYYRRLGFQTISQNEELVTSELAAGRVPMSAHFKDIISHCQQTGFENDDIPNGIHTSATKANRKRKGINHDGSLEKRKR
jgi:hypothetical protein